MDHNDDLSNSPIRTLIADDHPLFRYGVRRLLETEPGFSVVGEAADGKEVVELVRRLEPHVLLLDLAMPRFSGLDALRELANLSLPVRTIVLAAEVERPQIAEALQLGARGIVLKESATQMLIDSIHAVLRGQYWVGRESVSDLVELLHRYLPRPAGRPLGENFGLSPREMQVAGEAVAGLSNMEIAQKLALSEQTVKHHMTNVFDKLGVSNRMELALFLVAHQLGQD